MISVFSHKRLFFITRNSFCDCQAEKVLRGNLKKNELEKYIQIFFQLSYAIHNLLAWYFSRPCVQTPWNRMWFLLNVTNSRHKVQMSILSWTWSMWGLSFQKTSHTLSTNPWFGWLWSNSFSYFTFLLLIHKW